MLPRNGWRAARVRTEVVRRLACMGAACSALATCFASSASAGPSGAMLTVEAIEASAPAIPDATRIGAWLLSCGSRNQAADRHACALQSAGASGISAAIVVQPEKATPVLVLRAPLGVILPAGIDMAVDGKRLGRLAFQTCDRDAAPHRLSSADRSVRRSAGVSRQLSHSRSPVAARSNPRSRSTALPMLSADLRPRTRQPQE